MGIAADLMTLEPPERRLWLADQEDDDRAAVFALVRVEFGSPWAVWRDDPVGFIQDVLDEYVWTKQQQIATSVRDHRRTVVPACHAPGKTHLAARLVAWWVAVHEPGSALAVTTATNWRQVRSLLWPHIIRVAEKHGLPGRRNQVSWLINNLEVAWGFSPSRYDEAAGQGIHSEHLLVVVDEAGGIVPLLGQNLDSLMTGEGSRILAIGNPPTEEEAAWFESICESPLWHTLPIPASATPNFTGEAIPEQVARQLVDKRWVADIRTAYGEDSAYYVARVEAAFPKVFARKVVPLGWLEAAMVDPALRVEGGEMDGYAQSDWQRLGIDVAGGGGDEMVIAHADGNVISVLDTWANADSADQMVNADRALVWIHHCEKIQEARGYKGRKVRVKIDANGIGAGTADRLIQMGREKKHNADIVRVIVQESPNDPGRFLTRRDECWWTAREEIQFRRVWVKVNERDKSQMAGPVWEQANSGKIVVESKKKMKARGLPSPDRADAINLSIYEPVSIVPAQSYGHQTRAATMPKHVGRRRS